MKNIPKYIILHTTDYSYRNLKDQFLACNGWHRDRDFPLSSLGYFIGYHRFITDGKNYKAREDDEIGAHCNQQVDGLTMNLQSLGIVCGFDGDIEMMLPEDYKLFQQQVWNWQDQYGIPPSKVRFHRYYAKDKTCPGSLITDQWLADLLKRPLPIPETKKESLCTTDVVEKANKWDNLVTFIKNLTK